MADVDVVEGGEEQVTDYEDADDATTKGSDSSDSDQEMMYKPYRVYGGYKKPKHLTNRIEQLARPKRRVVLYVYKEFADFFDPERRERIRKTLEEEYYMTPEQTEKYFKDMEEKIKRLRKRRIEMSRMRKKIKSQRKVYTEENIRKKLEKHLTNCFIKAYMNPLKIIMTDKLLEMANIVELLLNDKLSKDKQNTEKYCQFFKRISEWVAYWIESVVYEVEADKLNEKNKAKDANQTVQNLKF